MEQRPAVHVCLVDDDEDYYVITRDLLAEIPTFSFKITWIDTYEKALGELACPLYDVFIFDYQLGPKNGIGLLREAIAKGVKTPVVMLTGQGDREIDVEAMKAGAADYLVKGKIDAAILERSLRYAIERFKTIEQLRSSRDALRSTAQQLEHALKNINEELETATCVQKSFLPQSLDGFPGVEIAAAYLPSGFIGGDMYDVVKIDETHVAFFVIDVCGHGVPAALITAMAKVSFGRYILTSVSPKTIFELVNAELCRFMPDGRYVTGFCAVLDTEKKELVFSRAGHPPTAYASALSNTVKYLSTGAPLIGAFPGCQFEESAIHVEIGDILVFYTDGLVESLNSKKEHYPLAEMEKIILGAKKTAADDVCSSIISSLKKFCGKTPQADDITVLVVKIL
jgi:serine phosphatase RsbU (regulator of sigma subunit)